MAVVAAKVTRRVLHDMDGSTFQLVFEHVHGPDSQAPNAPGCLGRYGVFRARHPAHTVTDKSPSSTDSKTRGMVWQSRRAADWGLSIQQSAHQVDGRMHFSRDCLLDLPGYGIPRADND